MSGWSDVFYKDKNRILALFLFFVWVWAAPPCRSWELFVVRKRKRQLFLVRRSACSTENRIRDEGSGIEPAPILHPEEHPGGNTRHKEPPALLLPAFITASLYSLKWSRWPNSPLFAPEDGCCHGYGSAGAGPCTVSWSGRSRENLKLESASSSCALLTIRFISLAENISFSGKSSKCCRKHDIFGFHGRLVVGFEVWGQEY